MVENKSSGTAADEESKRHFALIVVLVSLLMVCCCFCCRFTVQQCYGPHQVDEEKGLDADTPCGTNRSLKSGRSFWNFTPKSVTSSRSFWNFTPKSATSSPMAKWINKKQRAAVPSNHHKKSAVHPEPVEAVLTAKKHIQPAKGTGQDDPLCPPVMLQTHGSVLRHAARTHGGQSVPPALSIRPPPQLPPPQSICPAPQLPTLLQHKQGEAKKHPRRKPPLQGVPPQRATSEQATEDPIRYNQYGSYNPRSQAGYFV